MSRYESIIGKAEILEEAANRCIWRGLDDMAKMWQYKADRMRAVANMLTLEQAATEV